MQRLNIFQFYRFGHAIRSIGTIEEGRTAADEIGNLLTARKALEDLLEQQQISLLTAKQSIKELISAIDAIVPLDKDDFDFGKQIPRLLLAKLKGALLKFEAIFEAELARVDAYAVSNKGIYDTSLLIEQADLAIPDNLRRVMPGSAQQDLRQSGKCLAFEVSTAAGFHALRATESVIKNYYEKLAGKPWPYHQRDWGRYIDELKKLKAPVKITTALEQTKDYYRNPLIQPEDNLELSDAIGLFGMTLGLLSMILKEVV